MEKVCVNSMDPWTAATLSFGRDMDFLDFNSLAIAFCDDKGVYLDCYQQSLLIHSAGNVVGRKISRNQPLQRPWGIEASFSCITPQCKANSWDLTWHDNTKNRKRQYCPGCKDKTPWVSFDQIKGIYSNKVFSSGFPDIYWTPWSLLRHLCYFTSNKARIVVKYLHREGKR